MSDYAFEMTAQQWNNDSYYVSSSKPLYQLTVVASTKSEAVTEVKRLVGKPDRDHYWSIRVLSAKDVRLIRAEPQLEGVK